MSAAASKRSGPPKTASVSAAGGKKKSPPRSPAESPTDDGGDAKGPITSNTATQDAPTGAAASSSPKAAASSSVSVSATAAAAKGPPGIRYVNEFNKHIKLLALDMHKRFKTDANVWRAKERVMTAIATDPLFVIGLVGPYLYGYRDKIYSGEEKFFLDNDYGKEFQESEHQDRVELVMTIMPKIKAEWKTLDADTRKDYMITVVELLDNYVEYLCCVKGAK